ncbi:signal peptidase I [Streptomyces fulvoviolaceus]|uniref:signal peptidase I n=1 Tax=Streptomyces fulvoviolaceus TaxID=285535 RepID=UPI0004C6C083|nr:signal peptidase I [Streptomyces fulvoviolaceus]MCT9084392.1 signal peptidase I [Streptomyces fulvoviolaceus]
MSRARKLGVSAGVLGPLGLLLTIGSLVAVWTGYHGSRVSSESMTPTYEPGQQLIYERVDGTEVHRGDVVLYTAPERYLFDGAVMQRVIGVGGDHIVCCTGEGEDERLTVNGKPLDEPYVADGIANGMQPYDVKVPEGRLFVLGDHRLNSRDSRSFADDHDGTVPVGAVRGRVTDDYTGPVLLGLGALVGLLAGLTGIGLGIAALAVRQRGRVPVQPPWMVQM